MSLSHYIKVLNAASKAQNANIRSARVMRKAFRSAGDMVRSASLDKRRGLYDRFEKGALASGDDVRGGTGLNEAYIFDRLQEWLSAKQSGDLKSQLLTERAISWSRIEEYFVDQWGARMSMYDILRDFEQGILRDPRKGAYETFGSTPGAGAGDSVLSTSRVNAAREIAEEVVATLGRGSGTGGLTLGFAKKKSVAEAAAAAGVVSAPGLERVAEIVPDDPFLMLQRQLMETLALLRKSQKDFAGSGNFAEVAIEIGRIEQAIRDVEKKRAEAAKKAEQETAKVIEKAAEKGARHVIDALPPQVARPHPAQSISILRLTGGLR
jgi:hypothetical protein